MTIPDFRGPRESLARCRERDRYVCWLVSRHPTTPDMLVWLGWFARRRKATDRLRTLARRGFASVQGMVRGTDGRTQEVYCRWRAKPDLLPHEVEMTWLLLRLHAGSIERGPFVSDQTILPDAEVRIRGQLYYFELDRGTMGTAQMAQRFLKYERCPHFSLWVCPSAERMDALRRLADRLRTTALFTTYAEALADPHAPIWRDVGGGVTALPREPW